MIAEDTIESHVIEIQNRKKDLVTQVSSSAMYLVLRDSLMFASSGILGDAGSRDSARQERGSSPRYTYVCAQPLHVVADVSLQILSHCLESRTKTGKLLLMSSPSRLREPLRLLLLTLGRPNSRSLDSSLRRNRERNLPADCC